MKAGASLRFRLFAYAAIVVAAALLVTGLSLSALFSRHLERRVGQELDTHLNQLTGGLRIDENSELSLGREPVDPRFQAIFGGLYWQVDDETTQRQLKSRSLWDTYLDIPGDRLVPGETHVHEIAGPQGSTLLVHEILLLVSASDGDHRLRVAVAIDRAEISTLAAGFSRDLAPVLAILGMVLLLGFLLQIGEGLKPVYRVLEGVTAIRTGASRRLAADRVPREVAPLVEEVNALLDAQDQAISRARDRAANLAHGLKTPLSALVSDVERLRARGEAEIADDISELTESMRRHIQRELARARLRHGRSQDRTPLKPVVDGILRALKRTPEGEDLTLDCTVPPNLAVPVDPDDLNELIGNLAENAVRFARTRVLVDAVASPDAVVIRIADDGPGMSPDSMAGVVEPPRRLDQSTTGAGLGLSISGDIVESFGGRLELATASLGGLEARISIPLANTPTPASRPSSRLQDTH
ncbi:sensor histidine kinase [Hoeflea alexandrii]|uniref:sensor histidine kinase n=1 Tax=Hoeflea alexandrii TaxID=288436 RepID=UPI0022B00A37|nr:HAMP domain-containing sensor histidine kinase [Hoeflea alexandrii]MCZ4288965.1 HAMP domain-containing sensor histidine kinase [Hoeflea alexandrii]